MPKKRISPPEDYDRLSENLMLNYEITDRESFDIGFDDYLKEIKHKDEMREKTWKAMIKNQGIRPSTRQQLAKAKDQRKVRLTKQQKDKKLQRIRHYNYSWPAYHKGKVVASRRIQTKTGRRNVDENGRRVHEIYKDPEKEKAWRKAYNKREKARKAREKAKKAEQKKGYSIRKTYGRTKTETGKKKYGKPGPYSIRSSYGRTGTG